MDELKKLVERPDSEHEYGERRHENHGGRSRIHSFYPTEEDMKPEYRQFSGQQQMEPKKKHHRHSENRGRY